MRRQGRFISNNELKEVIRQFDDTHFQRGLQLFQLTRETIVPLIVVETSLADECFFDVVLAMGPEPLHQPQKAARAETTRRRLKKPPFVQRPQENNSPSKNNTNLIR